MRCSASSWAWRIAARSCPIIARRAYDETVSVMAGIPDDQRVRVAYLLGDNGLNAIAKTSFQAAVVDMVADNVVVVDDVSGKGNGNEISLEQIALWNPDLIVFQTGSIYDTVGDDPAWAGIAAIDSGNYYQVPNVPYCWLNNPPTVNQLMGLQWLPRLLYPDASTTPSRTRPARTTPRCTTTTCPTPSSPTSSRTPSRRRKELNSLPR